MVEGLDRLPVFLLGMIRETVLRLATGPDRDDLITDLMSSLAVGTGMHHMHLCFLGTGSSLEGRRSVPPDSSSLVSPQVQVFRCGCMEN
ncbi:hypothetical protein PIB30_041249 [Stylosanthes scabra]|uniref:Uncharacterized protein n=1 Tax=Stylosanthes scabra TaxID=79078 RepID=A0ABU6UI16_9FABA|nr:hypothetical protein [Stylosanthes scabra]